MKKLILSLLIATSALGQLWSPAQLKNHIATNLPSGSSITALKLRETMTNIVTSTLFATNNLSDLNSPSAARGNLGLVIGIDVQPYDSQLDGLSAGSLSGYVKANGTSDFTAYSTIPASDLSGLGTGIFAWLSTPSSANFAAALTDETGTGSVVLADGPTLIDPILGDASATSLDVSSGISAGSVDTQTLTISDYMRVGTGGTVIYEIKHGRATLVAGVATVSYTGVTTASRIMLGVYTPGGTRGFLDTGTRTPGTSFTITSSSITDTSVVDWVVVNP